MSGPQEDANIDRLFHKIDTIRETVQATRNEVSIVNTKVDDFSFRLKKLEDRDERHLEKENQIELLITKMETIVETREQEMVDLDCRVQKLEKDVSTLKNNWRWVVAIAGGIGSIFGTILASVIELFKG